MRIKGDPPGLKGGDVMVCLHSYYRGVVGHGLTLPQRCPNVAPTTEYVYSRLPRPFL